MIRIDTDYPGFSERFINTTDLVKQQIINYIVNYAVQTCAIADDIIAKALENLKTAEPYPYEKIREIEGLRDEYDETYFELNDADRETSSSYFKKARAVSSLVFALSSKSDNDRLECIYEALNAIGEKEKVFEELNLLLK